MVCFAELVTDMTVAFQVLKKQNTTVMSVTSTLFCTTVLCNVYIVHVFVCVCVDR